MKTIQKALLAGVFAFVAFQGADAASITTTDGTKITGDVDGLAAGIYTIRTPYGVIKVPASSVVKIETGEAVQGASPPMSSGTQAPPLRFAGSTTIGDELMPALIDRYSGSLGFAQGHWSLDGNDPSEQSFKATDAAGGTFSAHLSRHGSATAFTALAAGTADIGMASRPAKPEEIKTLAAAGFGTADATGQEHVLALDGLVVLVNRANPLTTLSLAQIGSIFSGEVTDWKDVGGTPGPIHVLARDKKSGTADTFNGIVMKDKKVVATADFMDSTDGLSDKVSSDPSAIGYAGFAYIRRAKALRLQTDCGMELPPNDFFVRTEEYPLSRRLFLYTSAHADEEAKQFVSYALGSNGQDEAAKKGFVDLLPRLSAPDYGPDRIAAALAQVASSNGDVSDLRALQVFNKIASMGRRLSITFRFRTGSFDLDTRAARDIDRLVTALQTEEFAGRKMVIVGFSDSQGSPTKNIRLSATRADRIARLLRDKGVVAQAGFGLGRSAPVACNSSPEGLEKNRRVEIWLLNPKS